MSRILFDLEANGFLPEVSKVHCIACVDVDTEERRFFGPHEVTDGVAYLAGHTLIAHNGIGYDFPVLEKLYGFRVPYERQLDTLVLARLIHPDVRDKDKTLNQKRFKHGEEPMGAETGRHSLRAWGKRLRIPKGDFDGPWDGYTEQMGAYCRQDVETSLQLWRYLDPDKYSQAAIELEHDVARLCDMITAAGWPFNEPEAQRLMGEWTTKKETLEKALVEEFKGWHQEIVFTPKVNNKTRGYVKGIPFTKHSWLPFSPRSRDHCIRALKDRGWKPTEFTESGKPKFDEEVIEGLAQTFGSATSLVDYLTVCKRLGQLATGEQAWLKKVRNGRIHASYNPMGTVTSRAAHYDPNIAQVPTVSAPYGKECRGLFYVPPGYVQLGADMEGLEARDFAHYLAKHDGGAYGRVLLTGDPHWATVRAAGLMDCERDKSNGLHEAVRTETKRLYYGVLYGAGDEKAGRIIYDVCKVAQRFGDDAPYSRFYGGSLGLPGQKAFRQAGSLAKFNLMNGIAGWSDLRDDLERILEIKSTLPGLDKRRLPIRSAHSALNALLQSAGAILCKRWMVDAWKALTARGDGYVWGRDYWFLGWIHDELQIAVLKDIAQEVGEIVVEAARNAGKPYGFRIPLSSAYKIGASWADTH